MTVLGRRTDVPSQANTIFGMLVVAFGTGIFCAAGAIGQYNGGSILQLRFGSYAIQNLMCWSWWFVRKPSQATNWYGDSPLKLNLWLRGFLFWVLIFAWLKGLEMVPIGDAEAIIFLSPILTVFIGKIYLKEALPKTYPITFIMTIVSLLFICQPRFLFGGSDDAEQVNWPGLVFLVVCVIAWSLVSILIRTGKDAHWLQVNLVTSFECAWILTPLVAVINHYVGNNLGDGNGTPASNEDSSNVAWIDGYDFDDWEWGPSTFITIFAMAFFEFFAVLCKVVGYQLGEATKVASMEYFDIIFAFGFQYWMFHRTPNEWELTGGAILLVSCAIQLLEEKFFPNNNNNNNELAIRAGDDKYNEELTYLMGDLDSNGHYSDGHHNHHHHHHHHDHDNLTVDISKERRTEDESLEDITSGSSGNGGGGGGNDDVIVFNRSGLGPIKNEYNNSQNSSSLRKYYHDKKKEAKKYFNYGSDNSIRMNPVTGIVTPTSRDE